MVNHRYKKQKECVVEQSGDKAPSCIRTLTLCLLIYNITLAKQVEGRILKHEPSRQKCFDLILMKYLILIQDLFDVMHMINFKKKSLVTSMKAGGRIISSATTFSCSVAFYML